MTSEIRVLVVDDNLDAAELMAVALDAHGFQVHVAHEAQRALELAGTHPPDVAVVDLGLPGMDGLELARRLRARRPPDAGPLRLIAVTGYGEADDRTRSRQAGFDEHLVKPIEVDELLRAVRGSGGHTHVDPGPTTR